MMDKRDSDGAGRGQGRSHEMKMYPRLGAMILTAMAVMYAMTFVGSWEWSHIRWSESRLFIALTMGGPWA